MFSRSCNYRRATLTRNVNQANLAGGLTRPFATNFQLQHCEMQTELTKNVCAAMRTHTVAASHGLKDEQLISH